jgi:hypothetical protein
VKDADASANPAWDRCSQALRSAIGVVHVDDDRRRWFMEAGVVHVKRSGSGDDMGGCRVGYVVGSLSTRSINRTLAKALIRLAPEHMKFVEIPIRDLPLYNHDFDTDTRQRVGRSRMRSPRWMRCCL